MSVNFKRTLTFLLSIALFITMTGSAIVLAEDTVSGPLASYTYDYTPDKNAYVESQDGYLMTGFKEASDSYLFRTNDRLGYSEAEAVDGNIVFSHEGAPITDYNFITNIGASNWGGTITFSKSVDGREWTAFTPAQSERSSGSWSSKIYNNFGSFAADEKIHYLRVELDSVGSGANLLPALKKVQYNTAAVTVPETYSGTVDLASPLSVSAEGNKITSSSGDFVVGTNDDGSNITESKTWYRIVDSANTKAAGSVVYEVPLAITDLRITTHEHSIIDNGGFSLFEVSRDGEKWQSLTVSRTQSYKYSNNSWGSYLYEYAATLEAASDYRYIRATATVGKYTNVPGIVSIDYNMDALPEEYQSNYTPTRSHVYKTESTGTLTQMTSNPNYEYYNFKPGANDTSTTNVDGKIYFKSEQPITDYQFTVAQTSSGSYAGFAYFYASSDGVNYRQISPYQVKDDSISFNSSWSSAVFNCYGSFAPEENIHYLCVYLDTNSTLKAIPALNRVKYNTTATSVTYSQTADLTAPYSSVAGEGSTAVASADSYKFSHSTTDSASGVVTYKSEAPITDLYVKMYLAKDQLCDYYGTIRISVSSDGEKWEDISPRLKYIGSWQYEGCTTLEAADNYRFIRFAMEGGAWGNAALYSLKYNTSDYKTAINTVKDELTAAGVITLDDAQLIQNIYNDYYALSADEREDTAVTVDENWLYKAKVISDYMLANNAEEYVIADAAPQYAGMQMSVLTSPKQSFKYHINQSSIATVLSAQEYTDLYYGVLYMGRNVTKEELIAQIGVADYTCEQAVVSSNELVDYELEIYRSGVMGQRVTVLPYIRFTQNGEDKYLFADEVISKSPAGFVKDALKQAVYYPTGIGDEITYNADMASAVSTAISGTLAEKYTEITKMEDIFKGICKSENQTAARKIMNSYGFTDATADQYYQLLLDLFSADLM